MSRAIDADALKDVIQQHDYLLADRINSIDNGMFTLGIFQAIDEQPTISPDDVRGVGEWVKVEERLPEEWREVLTCSPIHSDEKNPHMIQLCWYIGNGKWRECQYGEIMEIPITHWMPLPEPPKEVE